MSFSMWCTMPMARQNIPVRLKEDIDYWLQRGSIKDLANASVAWTGKARGPYSSAIYQLVWSNPRPDVEIESLDLEYTADGKQWGSPVLLAITAATERYGLG